MFGFRGDGVRVKKLDLTTKIVPYIMSTRNDACNQIMHDVRVEDMDAWIKKVSNEKGVSLNYLHVLCATAVRMFAIRQEHNRFVVKGVQYQRKEISISLTIKTNLRDDSTAASSTLKVCFTGRETVFEVKEILDQAIKDAVASNNGTQGLVSKLGWLPNWLLGGAVGLLKLLDRYGLLPKALLKASPFHTSVYITYLKSIKSDAIYHHLYNFGTTGLFVAAGKDKIVPVVEDEKLTTGKVMTLGYVMDERFTDGFYYVKSLKMWDKMFHNLEQLEEPYEITDPVILKEEKKQLKKLKRTKLK